MLLSQSSKFLFTVSALARVEMEECGSSRGGGGDSEVARAPVSPLYNAIISRSSGS